MAETMHDSALFEKTPAHLNNRIKMFQLGYSEILP